MTIAARLSFLRAIPGVYPSVGTSRARSRVIHPTIPDCFIARVRVRMCRSLAVVALFACCSLPTVDIQRVLQRELQRVLQ